MKLGVIVKGFYVERLMRSRKENERNILMTYADIQYLTLNSLCFDFFLVNDSVRLGGSTAVQMSRNDFNYAKAAHKPTAMALRLVDALFPKEVLLRSTVHGTKEYAPLDRGVIAAIKG